MVLSGVVFGLLMVVFVPMFVELSLMLAVKSHSLLVERLEFMFSPKVKSDDDNKISGPARETRTSLIVGGVSGVWRDSAVGYILLHPQEGAHADVELPSSWNTSSLLLLRWKDPAVPEEWSLRCSRGPRRGRVPGGSTRGFSPDHRLMIFCRFPTKTVSASGGRLRLIAPSTRLADLVETGFS